MKISGNLRKAYHRRDISERNDTKLHAIRSSGEVILGMNQRPARECANQEDTFDGLSLAIE
jgi:hypothetical protein